MPDPIYLLKVMIGAAGLAAIIVLAGRWPWRAPYPARSAVCEALAAGIVFLLGSRLVWRWPRWPLLEAEDRLIVILLPAAMAVEIVAAFRSVPRWLAWLLRLGLAVAVAPVLLYDSQYLTDSAGPGTRLWSTEQTLGWFFGLAAALALVWLVLGLLGRRGMGLVFLVALAFVCAGAAPTVMFSGYLTEGPLFVPLGGALVGTAVACSFGKQDNRGSAAIGVCLVMLFGLLVIGRFFGDPGLSNGNAALLFFAPLLAWLPTLLPGKKPGWLVRSSLRIALVIIPVALAFYLTQKPAPGEESRPESTNDPSVEDYEQFHP